MADRVEINISRIKIAGVGGFGMLAMVGVMAYAMPEARRFVLLSYSAGILGAFVFIAYRRWIKPERPHGPTLMTVNTPERTGEREDRIRPETPSKLVAMRTRVVVIALSIAIVSTNAMDSSKRMADGKEWTTANLNVNTSPSYCYEDAEPNCRRYGRLYTWESAQQVCQSLGDGWRLPTDAEWRQMAKHYGGVSGDSADNGKAAFSALLRGGRSGFNAVLGGNRSRDGQYGRSEAHGFYWTASDNDPGSAPFYNFGKGGQALHRQPQGEKQMAISVRCIRG